MICRLVLRSSEPREKYILESHWLCKFLIMVLSMQLIGALVLRNIFQLKINSSIVLLKRKIWTDWIYLELMLLSGGMKSM